MHQLTDNKECRNTDSESKNAFELVMIQRHKQSRDHKKSFDPQNIAYIICNKFIVHFRVSRLSPQQRYR